MSPFKDELAQTKVWAPWTFCNGTKLVSKVVASIHEPLAACYSAR